MSVAHYCSKTSRWSSAHCEDGCPGTHLLRHVGPERVVMLMNAVMQAGKMLNHDCVGYAINHLNEPLRWMTVKQPTPTPLEVRTDA